MRYGAWIAIAGVFVFSFALRLAFPIYAMGTSAYDDFLFLRLASHLREGEWLGPYDNLTHAKGAAYSMFIALANLLRVPLKVAEHAAYLSAALYLAAVLARQLRSRAALVVIFTLLAFNPMFWAPETGGRVVRENLYVTLGMVLIALCIQLYVGRLADKLNRRAWGALVALGLCGGAFWLTREEGLWLVPALLVTIASWAWLAREAPGWPRRAAIAFAVPAAVFLAVVGLVNAVNLAQYGVFRNNDFRSPDFQAAYGALARVAHDKPRRFDVFPRDARERVYAVSAAARELQPFLEGDRGAFWRQVSCEQTQGAFCDEVHSGWFMWELRDVVAYAGHYGSAPKAKAFYERLAAEVNGACEQGRIPCGPPNASLIPPWQHAFLADTAVEAWRIFRSVSALGEPAIYIAPSSGSAEQLGLYRRMTLGHLSGTESLTGPRRQVAAFLAQMQVACARVAFPVAIVLWVVLVALRRRPLSEHVVAASLLAAVAARIALLAFLDATSIPSRTGLYPSPAVPFVPAFIVFVGWMAARALAPWCNAATPPWESDPHSRRDTPSH